MLKHVEWRSITLWNRLRSVLWKDFNSGEVGLNGSYSCSWARFQRNHTNKKLKFEVPELNCRLDTKYRIIAQVLQGQNYYQFIVVQITLLGEQTSKWKDLRPLRHLNS